MSIFSNFISTQFAKALDSCIKALIMDGNLYQAESAKKKAKFWLCFLEVKCLDMEHKRKLRIAIESHLSCPTVLNVYGQEWIDSLKSILNLFDKDLIENLIAYVRVLGLGQKNEADKLTGKILEGLVKVEPGSASFSLVNWLLLALENTIKHNKWDNHMKTVLKPYAVELYEGLQKEDQEKLKGIAAEVGIG